MMRGLLGRSLAEFIGTAVLVGTVVGSGIMGTNLSDDLAVALIVNALATIFVLALLIFILGPISGAHFNPVVSFISVLRKSQKAPEALAYSVSQILGAITGSITANFMFNLPAIQLSSNLRVSPGTLLGEVIATAGLIIVIFVLIDRKRTELIPITVAGWIGAAYFFTSSTSFANPAVTIGRAFTDTFSGIAPDSVAPFIAAQFVGAILGLVATRALSLKKTKAKKR
jgi:glycerol uptake facilitator-like aquaporin